MISMYIPYSAQTYYSIKPTNNMEVIRIEHPNDGLGIFHSSYSDDWDRWTAVGARHTLERGFPGLDSDRELVEKLFKSGQIFFTDRYHFAYKSLDQLKSGFEPSDLKDAIDNLGFRIYILEVTDFFTSKYQVIFKKSSIISKKDISFMFL